MLRHSATVAKDSPPAVREERKAGWNWKEVLSGYLFIFPNLLFVLIFFVYPLLDTIKLSFYKADLAGQSFVGLQNYSTVFSDPIFWNSLKNTVYFALIIVPVVVAVSFTLAALMRNMRNSSKAFFRVMFYLPVISTPVVLTMIWSWIYNTNFGILTYFRSLLGFAPTEILGTPTSAILAVSVVVATWSIGQPVILYLSSVDGIPKDYYEAAEIDGAGRLRKLTAITLPLVAHTTLFVTITTTIAAFQIFAVIYLLTGGGPYYGTETLVYTIYRTAFNSYEFGLASAQGVVLFVIIMAIALVQLRLLKVK
jgi:ABC-type sugar transport system permease subunit